MPRVEIKPVATRQERRQFLELPWTLYRGDPNWIPPLRHDQQELVGYRPHPFYAENKVQTFLALRDGVPCGRIAAVLNYGHIRRHNDPRGFFGFFESIDDQEVASGLFDAARAWLAGHGIEAIRGPCNPSLNYTLGLLIDGFHEPPFFMMTYNHRYYERLVEEYGFRKTQDLYAYWGHIDMLDKLDKKLEFIVAEARRRFNITTRRMDRSRFSQEVRQFLHIYNESLGGTWGYVPMSEAEIDHLARSLRHLLVPEMTTAAEVDGKMIGACLGLLDYNPRIKKIDGRLFPFGFIRLLWNKRAIKRVRLVSTNVLPEYQRMGVGLVLLNRLVADALAWKMEEGEFSWVLESNDLSRGSLERGGAIRTKTYRLYDYPPPAAQATGENPSKM